MMEQMRKRVNVLIFDFLGLEPLAVVLFDWSI